jgi:hypothetical protein
MLVVLVKHFKYIIKPVSNRNFDINNISRSVSKRKGTLIKKIFSISINISRKC